MQPVETAIAVRQPVPAGAKSAALSVHGKFFFAGDAKFFVKGVTYGPFAPGSHGAAVPGARDGDPRLPADGGDGRQHAARLHRAAASGCSTSPPRRGSRCWPAFPGRSTSPFSTARRCRPRSSAPWSRRCAGSTAIPPSSPISSATRSRRTWCAGTGRSGCAPSCKSWSARSRRSIPEGLVSYANFPLHRIPHHRLHRFPLLQRLSAQRARLPPLSLAPAQPRRRPAAGADRVRHRFAARGQRRSRRRSCPGSCARPSRWASPAPSSSPGPTNGSPAAI